MEYQTAEPRQVRRAEFLARFLQPRKCEQASAHEPAQRFAARLQGRGLIQPAAFPEAKRYALDQDLEEAVALSRREQLLKRRHQQAYILASHKQTRLAGSAIVFQSDWA